MGNRSQPALNARAERRAMLAIVAVFALFIQTLWPVTAAAAAGPDLGPGLQICTGHGLETAAPAGQQAPTQGAPAQPCHHCVCPAVAATPVAPLAVAAPARLYMLAVPAMGEAAAPPPARAPPRPPGQGPPTSNA